MSTSVLTVCWTGTSSSDSTTGCPFFFFLVLPCLVFFLDFSRSCEASFRYLSDDASPMEKKNLMHCNSFLVMHKFFLKHSVLLKIWFKENYVLNFYYNKGSQLYHRFKYCKYLEEVVPKPLPGTWRGTVRSICITGLSSASSTAADF